MYLDSQGEKGSGGIKLNGVGTVSKQYRISAQMRDTEKLARLMFMRMKNLEQRELKGEEVAYTDALLLQKTPHKSDISKEIVSALAEKNMQPNHENMNAMAEEIYGVALVSNTDLTFKKAK